jgi:hypothetical protein
VSALRNSDDSSIDSLELDSHLGALFEEDFFSIDDFDDLGRPPSVDSQPPSATPAAAVAATQRTARVRRGRRPVQQRFSRGMGGESAWRRARL